MTYIEQLQDDKKLLVDYFNASIDFDEKVYRYENTAYKGDAMNALNASKRVKDALTYQVSEMLNRKTTKKEAVNA
jgi:hypothetical protein